MDNVNIRGYYRWRMGLFNIRGYYRWRMGLLSIVWGFFNIVTKVGFVYELEMKR